LTFDVVRVHELVIPPSLSQICRRSPTEIIPIPQAGPSSVAYTFTCVPTEVPYTINSKQIVDLQILKNQCYITLNASSTSIVYSILPKGVDDGTLLITRPIKMIGVLAKSSLNVDPVIHLQERAEPTSTKNSNSEYIIIIIIITAIQ
jgi:hypothetical protein